MPAKQSKAWTLTVFNDAEIDDFIEMCKEANVDTYSYQEELCPDTGKIHLQAFVYYAKKIAFGIVKKRFKTAHITAANNPSAAFDYCQKEDTRRPGGRRLAGANPWNSGKGGGGWRMYKEYAKIHTWRECLDMWPELRIHQSTMQDIWNDMHVRELMDTKYLKIFVGPSGTGKSTTAKELLGTDYYHHTGTKWWTGYKGQTKILIDDLNPKEFTRAFLLNMMDNPEGFVGEVKGGSIDIRWDSLIITTQYEISDWFGKKGDLDKEYAFYRRAAVWNFSMSESPMEVASSHAPSNTKAQGMAVQSNINFFFGKLDEMEYSKPMLEDEKSNKLNEAIKRMKRKYDDTPPL